MAVLRMRRVSICALKKDQKPILEALQRQGMVEITNLDSQDSVFQKEDLGESRSQADRNAGLGLQALEVLATYAPAKTSMLDTFVGRQALTTQEFQSKEGQIQQSEEIARRLTELSRFIAEGKGELVKLTSQTDALSPWMALDLPMNFPGTRSTAAFIGSFGEELTLEGIYSKVAQAAPELEAVHADLISVSKDQTCVFFLVPKKDSSRMEEALRSIGFIRPSNLSSATPKEQAEALHQKMIGVEDSIQKAVDEITALSSHKADLEFLVDYYRLKEERYENAGRMLQSKRTFLLSGYIPERDAPALEKALTSRFDLSIEFAEPSEEEDVPVAIHNNKFAAPLEGVLESYSLPSKGEIDPTSMMSIFYYALFGLMLSDFGYGAILALGTGFLLLKYKNMDDSWRKNLTMFFYCGISTSFWGIVFSSYFGDVVTVVSRTFFGQEIVIPPAWFTPLDDPMRLMVFCMAVGVVHLFTGLGIQLYQHLKAGRYYDAFAKVIVWYMLVGGLIIYGLSTDLLLGILQVNFRVPASVGTIFAWIALVGAIGIVLTGGDSKNPAVRFAQGLYELYNVTGYLSDILSYSRLLALGLATGVIGSVVNQMGSMGGGGPLGAILFIVVFLFGHTLNFGIEVLGAYVHCNRLQYVEFFGKFYEGGGRKFQPFAAHTKYYKFEEDIHHE